MARDTKTPQTDTEIPPEDAPAAPAKRKKLIIILLSVIVVAGLTAGGVFFAMKSTSASDSADAESASEESEKKPAIYYALTPAFIVNFQDKGRSRFLQTDLTLVIRDEDVAAALDMHMPLIRNNLVMLLSGQTLETLQSTEGKEALGKQALQSVQDVMQKEIGKPGVEQVLFTSFVMQ